MPSDPIDGKQYLSIDLDKVAYTTEHIAVMVCAGIALLVFTLGAPAIALVALVH